jgi:hypothetical protein
VPVVLVLGLVVAGFVVADRTIFTHDLLSADFTSGAAPFATGTMAAYSYDVVDGTYQISVTSTPDSPGMSYAWMSRTAYSAEASATVVSVLDPGNDAVVGIGCLDDPNANGHGYLFVAGPGGYALFRSDQPGPTLLEGVDATYAWGSGGQRITIVCEPQGLTTAGSVAVRGLVDGTEVIRATDHGGFGTYRAVVLVFTSQRTGAAVRFDDVAATLPGE